MATVKMPGSDILLDPDEIVRLEISARALPQVKIKISFRGEAEPLDIDFPDRKSAIDFYKLIWSFRESNSEELIEIGDFS